MRVVSATVNQDAWPLRDVFTISRVSMTTADTVTVILYGEDGHIGRGSCVPCRRYGETVASVIDALRQAVQILPADLSINPLIQLLPQSVAARNAMDAALLDLQAKQSGVPAWRDLGLMEPQRIRTTDTTISLATPSAMYEATQRALKLITHSIPRLKVKLGGSEQDLMLESDRLAAVRQAAPAAELTVDCNEGWTPKITEQMVPNLKQQKIMLLEQPLPVDADHALTDLEFSCPVFADESAHDLSSLPHLIGKYQGMCIKLDKTGGLSAALKLRTVAEAAGLQIMVGCMVGSSLCLAPAVLLAQGANIIADLDGAALLAKDIVYPLQYADGYVYPPTTELWG